MSVFREYWINIKMFSRNAKLYLMANTLRGLGFGFNTVIFNLYLIEAGLGKDFVGLRVSLLSLVAVIFSLPGGWLSDTIGHRRSLMIATTVVTASTIVQIVFPSRAIIIAAVWVMGIANVILMVAQNPFLAENSTPRERAHLFGISFSLMTLSGVFGSLLGGYLPKLYSQIFSVGVESLVAYRYTLITGALIACIALIPLFLMEERQNDSRGKKRSSGISFAKLTSFKLAAKFVAPQFVTALGAGLVIPFLNVFYREYLAASSGQIGIIFSWQSVVTAAATLIAPIVAVRMGKIKSMVTAQLASLPFLLVMALSGNIWIVAVAAWMRTALMNMANPVLSNFTMEVIPKNERATVNSLTNMAWNLGWAISSRTAGYVMANYSFRWLFAGTIGFYLAATALYWVFFHDFEQKQQVAVIE